MTNKFVKYRFNLIEVVLAIVILSLGMASIFVLFPVGLSNHTDAMAENSIADMAETIISHVRANAALNINEDGFGSMTIKKLSDFKEDGSDEPDIKFKEIEVVNGQKDLWTFKDAENGFYFVRQLSGPQDDPYVDFAAVVRVYKDENFTDELFVPVDIAGEVKHFSEFDLAKKDDVNLKELDLNKVVLPLVIEISYPADRPYTERTKAYFRFEVFNEAYKLKETD